MVKYKEWVFVFLILFFLLFSFTPTIFELSSANNLTDKNREFILEHNYYWPDYNLYLSKIRQGFEGRLTAQEKYTSETHAGSLIQEFYVILGLAGRFLGLVPNYSYLLGRIILAPLLLLVILKLVKYYFAAVQTRFVLTRQTWFDRSVFWQLIAFLIVIVSGSFPRFWIDTNGTFQIGRYMEWWSNIDALQRLTFIPHILFGQVVSFFLLYQLVIRVTKFTMKQLIFYILLGNLVGLVFPPSLITLNGVLILSMLITIIRSKIKDQRSKPSAKLKAFNFKLGFDFCALRFALDRHLIINSFFIIFTLPSILYIFFMTKYPPWSALVEFHRTHPMMIPFDQYVLGTGPIMISGFLGAVVSIVKRDRIYQPLIFWVTVTLGMASFFSIVKEQSPLRFTQTGLFIPLGILGAYFFQQISFLINSKFEYRNSKQYLNSNDQNSKRLEHLDFENSNLFRISDLGFRIFILFYLLENLFMMKVSLDWQTTWIKQLVNATYPAVPQPPQTMFPLKSWMAGIRWLGDNTNHNDVILAEVTAGNYIPAYSGNFVYFGQANTVDYERKQQEVDRFFRGKMSDREVELFLKNGRIKYIFFGPQEKEKTGGKELHVLYPFLKPVYTNSLVTIYSI